jgi:hypothetical protein
VPRFHTALDNGVEPADILEYIDDQIPNLTLKADAVRRHGRHVTN